VPVLLTTAQSACQQKQHDPTSSNNSMMLTAAAQQMLYTSHQKEEWHIMQWCCALWHNKKATECCDMMHNIAKLCSSMQTQPKMPQHNVQCHQTPWHNAQNL